MKRLILLSIFFIFCPISALIWTLAFKSSLGWGGGGVLFIGMLIGFIGLFSGGYLLGDKLQLKSGLWPALFVSAIYALTASIAWTASYPSDNSVYLFPALFLTTSFGWLGIQLLTPHRK
jgi:hypothetical protein